MKRIAALSAVLALSTAAGFAQAQVSSDDFSTLTGPNAQRVALSTQAPRPAAVLVSNVQLEQGLVGPGAGHDASTVTRAQVIRERNQAIAHGDLQPGAEYFNVVGAPSTHSVAGVSYAVPAGQ